LAISAGGHQFDPGPGAAAEYFALKLWIAILVPVLLWLVLHFGVKPLKNREGKPRWRRAEYEQISCSCVVTTLLIKV